MKLPPASPLYTNPVHVEDIWEMKIPGRVYVPVYASTIMSKNLNFYLMYISRVGTIIPVLKKELPIENWILCDGSIQTKENFPMLYDVIKGLFGEYTDETFVLPGFEYNKEIQDEDRVYVIKYYQKLIGRGDLKQDNPYNEDYYYVLADHDDSNPDYLDEKVASMFSVKENKLTFTNSNNTESSGKLLYYGTRNGVLGYWPFFLSKKVE